MFYTLGNRIIRRAPRRTLSGQMVTNKASLRHSDDNYTPEYQGLSQQWNIFLKFTQWCSLTKVGRPWRLEQLTQFVWARKNFGGKISHRPHTHKNRYCYSWGFGKRFAFCISFSIFYSPSRAPRVNNMYMGMNILFDTQWKRTYWIRLLLGTWLCFRCRISLVQLCKLYLSSPTVSCNHLRGSSSHRRELLVKRKKPTDPSHITFHFFWPKKFFICQLFFGVVTFRYRLAW